MRLSEEKMQRIQFLSRIIQKEIRYLSQTNQRLFAQPLGLQQVKQLEENIQLAEQVDAFASRFGRLQDTVGDKLLPGYLDALGEKVGAAIDNLNKAEKLGLIQSAELWLVLRDMRNQMVHEYMEDLEKLTNALNKAHENVPVLINDAQKILEDIKLRNWL